MKIRMFSEWFLATIVLTLWWVSSVFAGTVVDVEYQTNDQGYTVGNAYDDRNGTRPNQYWDNSVTNPGPDGSEPQAYRIQDGKLQQTVSSWTWTTTIRNQGGYWHTPNITAPHWENVNWQKIINITNDDKENDPSEVPHSSLAHGDGQGTDGTLNADGEIIDNSYGKGSGNTLNLSGRGDVSGTLAIFDDYINGNTVRLGIKEGAGGYVQPGSLTNPMDPSSRTDGQYYIDPVTTGEYGGGNITGTLDMGYGVVDMYSGVISGTLNARTSTANALAASEAYYGVGDGHGASTVFSQYGGEVSGKVVIDGAASSNRYNLSGYAFANDIATLGTYITGEVSDAAEISMNGTGSTNMFLHSAGQMRGVVNLDGADSNNHYIVTGATLGGGYAVSADILGSTGDHAVIKMDGSGSTNRFTQDDGTVNEFVDINMNGLNSNLNLYQQVGGDNAGKITIGNQASTTGDQKGIYYQGGGTKTGADSVSMIGGENLFWVNSLASFQAGAAISDGNTKKGDNVVVVDLNSPHASGLARGVDMNGTIDLSGATGDNNMFLANGDVYGTITTSGGAADSSTLIFIGNVDDVYGNNYSWRDAANEAAYDLTGISGIPSSIPAGVTGAPTVGNGYFSLGQIRDTDHLNVKKITGGGGDTHIIQTAGNLYNDKSGVEGLDADETIFNSIFQDPTLPYDFPFMIPTGYPGHSAYDYSPIYNHVTPGVVPSLYSTFQHTRDFANGGDYLVYSVLNKDAINVGAYVDPINGDTLYLSPADVTIGAIKDVGVTSYDNSYKPVDLNSNTIYIPNDQDQHDLSYYLDNTNSSGHTYRDYYDGHQAQITAGIVNVYAGSKLTIHPNYTNFLDDDYTEQPDTRNIIDNLNIVGRPDDPASCNGCGYGQDGADIAKVTIDRTTIHTLTAGTSITHNNKYYLVERDPNDPDSYILVEKNAIDSNPDGVGTYRTMYDYTANVVVGTNGYLQGWAKWDTSASADPNDHTPIHANVVGDVAVLSGGTLRPYDSEIFVVHGNALQYGAGTDPDQLYEVGGGGSLRPDYFASTPGNDIFEQNATNLKGVIMKIEGTTYFEHASRLSTRLFADLDGTNTLDIISDGTDTALTANQFTPKDQTVTVARYWGDSVLATDFNFDDIAFTSVNLENGLYNLSGVTGNTISTDKTQPISKDIWSGVAQHNKVQYVPVFGFVNELKSKLDYKLYKGTDESGDQTYYYQVAYSDGTDPIRALQGMDDANHIFNRDILFSDMLGNWSFEQQDDGKGVVLRYRMLAKHAQDGGIAIDQKLRNSREVARKLDEIRYPFLTAYNRDDPGLAGIFFADPSLDGKRVENGAIVDYETPYDTNHLGGSSATEAPYYPYDGNPYDKEGFSGDIEEFYATVAAGDPDNKYGYNGYNPFTNYKKEWVHDIANYFHALQLNVGSMDEIHRSLRLLSAEPYASQANADLTLMNSFIANRERNGVSALYMVEERERMTREEAGEFQSPLDYDMPMSYVQNPMRVWATFTGNNFSQKASGDEYGFRVKGHGVQLGVIKEIGDAYFGLTGAYSRTTNDWAKLQAKNKSDNFMGEALFGLRRGNFFLELSANAGYMDHSMVRDLTQGNYLSGAGYDPLLDCDLTDNYYNGVYSVTHEGEYHNRVLGGGLRLGYQMVLLEKWLFLPTIGVRFQDIRNPKAFNETGRDIAAFKLEFDKGGIERQSLQIPVMLRISRGISWINGGPTILTPEFRIGATYEAMDRGGKADFLWCGNPIPNRRMKSWGIKEDRLGFQAGVTLEVSRRGRFYGALNYDVNYRDDSFSHSYSVQAGFNF